MRKSCLAVSGVSVVGSPTTTSRVSIPAVDCTQASSSATASFSERPSSSAGPSPSTVRCVSVSAARAADRASTSARVGSSPVPDARSAASRCSSTVASPRPTVSCTSRITRSRSASTTESLSFSAAIACSRAFAMAIAACVAKSSTRVTSSSVNRRAGSRLNTTHVPMIDPFQRIGTPTTPCSDARSSERMWPPRTSAYSSKTTERRARTTSPVTPSSRGKVRPERHPTPRSTSLR